ncbi:branched-chain amino acid ABC transporter permease [Chromohalobacter japonicus]|uniref:Branched-chain amino acid ABC transporter permease n=1 Tax=Chromohalobacter japonicus TaxID=223900 RepID=A0A1Q8THZ3_9GAMM|nr:branched-chain amino acid ABC transporter permease [Chromohalobacter japonicus]OLO13266.1 branched-chain amino acid ABC transporter permease [Chromohalobacter japonicus]
MPILFFVVGILALAVVPLVFPASQFLLTLALAKGVAALGVAVLLRAGLISLGHAMYFAIGAYAAAFLSSRFGMSDMLIIILVATFFSALFGALFGAFLVRYRAIFFAMLNLAVSMVLYALVSKLYRFTGGTDGMSMGDLTLFGIDLQQPLEGKVLFYFTLLFVSLIAWCMHRYLKSPLGIALSAVHSNEIRLEYIGTSAWFTLLISYVISAAVAGMGGALAAMSIGHVLPEYAFWTESGQLVLTAVLGGIGSVAGPIVGSVFLEAVHHFALVYAEGFWNIIIGSTLIAVIVFFPNGIYGIVSRKFPKYKKEVK